MIDCKLMFLRGCMSRLRGAVLSSHHRLKWLAGALGLLGLVCSPVALALPDNPSDFTVTKVTCVNQCSDEQLSAAQQALVRRILRVGDQVFEFASRSCTASKGAAGEASTMQNLKGRWPGLATLALPDTTALVVHAFACNDSTYFVLEMNNRRRPLFVVTPDGLLLIIDLPTASMPPPSPAPPPPPPPPVVTSVPPPDTVPRAGDTKALNTVRVFFGTSRAKTDSQKPAELFGVKRGELVVGELEVSLPPGHAEGEIEQPKLWRLEFSEDPNKHVVLQAVTPWPMASFRKNLQDALAKDPEGATFLFIHGFNVSFKEAALRTAQLAWDLRLVTAPLMFSWPSQGEPEAYPVDEDNVDWTVPHLKTFLREVTSQPGAKKIHVIAHSMGNRALVQALQGFERPNNKPRFNQIVLAAADIDADVFKEQIAPGVMAAGERVTIYASDKDKALKASKKFHGDKRVGDASGLPLIIPGIDTIDASAVDTDFLGHSYFADEKKLLEDIRQLIAGAAAELRKLKREIRGNATFWRVP